MPGKSRLLLLYLKISMSDYDPLAGRRLRYNLSWQSAAINACMSAAGYAGLPALGSIISSCIQYDQKKHPPTNGEYDSRVLC